MTITLDRLPFDVLFNITESLRFDDIINLGLTCRQLHLLLNENTLCRRTIEAHFPHSKEAQLAQDQKITYTQALRSVHDRREAFSNAYPFSASVVGQGNAFTYKQGILCILQGNIVRILDIHSSCEAIEIDLSPILASLPELGIITNDPKLSLLYYSEGIVAVHYERKGRPSNSRIFAISTKANTPNSKRLIRNIQLESSSKLFVRHTARYLYYGTYTGTGSHGHHEWEIRGVSLDKRYPLPPCSRPLQLEEFFGTDIGLTIAFEIHENYFYALSNQTSFDVEELDWTSFYHAIRFPLDQPLHGALDIEKRLYRRQHAEGPINDSWTDLTIQFDERTNEPMIVESRREWQNGSSRQSRTFYISDITFPDKSTEELENDALMLPPDDVFSSLVDSSNNAHWAPEQHRYASNFHPEFGGGCPPTRSFILSRTKFRAYNFACSSFIDLVEDDKCCNDPSAGPCLRIRVGSRRIAPSGWAAPDIVTTVKNKSGSSSVPKDDVYRHSRIKIWPPPASKCPCSKRLHGILNPQLPSGSSQNRTVTGVIDARTLVYMVRPGKSYSSNDDNTLGSIVIVKFNRNVEDLVAVSSDAGAALPRHEGQMQNEFSPDYWQWLPRHVADCDKAQCR